MVYRVFPDFGIIKRGVIRIRSAKESKDFPCINGTVCCIGVDNTGDVMQIAHDSDSICTAYRSAIEQKIRIFAVWPGKYRSDLFEIDDLDAFGVRGISDHAHKIAWPFSPSDDGKSMYATINAIHECGCVVNLHNIKKFSNDMSVQKGWDLSTSSGISYHVSEEKTEYTFRVRRESLQAEH